ncbi:uncharacterized protein B0P05DRAFT_536668 [Gilbertella persicaria]|uniref:uncharacterized protein n=1 Tax=Gilbertella persicaria TaxID=101096 RepID=UPI0022203B10|nr:uncharacterized protein B0P05DRAFT_536668 [Gilbertella persicaria]KAI8083245.1 hypothetical protein B0P05DRAFT_536668 [Gilbertella persicaria]
MSKWILDDDHVINIIVTKVVGEAARDKYITKPTEWPNYTKSDVLYCPIQKKELKDFPPILIEVQHTANMKFYRRLMKYSLSVWEQYSVSPIVIAICVHYTSNELLEMSSVSDRISFMKELPSHGWAKSCLLINKESILNFEDETPLEPVVALAHFFVEQKTSLLHIKRHDDATVQLLYSIAKRIFEGELDADKDKDDALEEVCNESYNQLAMAKRLLAEDVSDEAARKRTIDCLDSGIKFINDFKKKHKLGPYSPDVANEPTASSVVRVQKINPDWQFVDSYRKEKGKDMDWKKCFELAKEKGLFKKYTKMDSAKAAYFRAKK